MSDKPEALLLAGQLESGEPVTGSAAAKLRRLHVVNQELLEALTGLIDLYDGRHHDGLAIVSNARAAIAKATGEQA